MRKYVFAVVLLALAVGMATSAVAYTSGEAAAPMTQTTSSGSGWSMSIPGISIKHSEKVPTAFVQITWPTATFNGPAGGIVELPAGEAFHEFDTTEIHVDLSGSYADQAVKADGKPIQLNCLTLDTRQGRAKVILGWDGRAKDFAKVLGLFGNINVSDDIIPIREMVTVHRQDRQSDYLRMVDVAKSDYPHANPNEYPLYAKAWVLARYSNVSLDTLDSYEAIEATMRRDNNKWLQQEEARRAAEKPASTLATDGEPATPAPTTTPAPTMEPVAAPKPDPWAAVLTELQSFGSPNGFLFVAVDAQQMPSVDEFSLVLWVQKEGKWVISKSQRGGPEQLRMTQGRGDWKFQSATAYEQAGWQGFGFSLTASTPPTHAPIRFGSKPRIVAVSEEAGVYEIEGR